MNAELEIQNQKIELIQWLSTLEDVSIIQKIVDLRKTESRDWWDSISDTEKASIEKGIADANAGKLNTHSKARDIYGKWL
ncbi:hypothetical protein R1T16_10690 [Flavobacterium sp. DG1-102-2]|uniref:hypothetical protein n=1 Tax=Flavobacterium sp. DG1-102-2 TaxID=3081663 RepID=UPI002948D098|nr:hypothetical protein [Flavobacterium sp. DG1-102-2]MDV6168894.1 hypothetical protein [Flavobacterium sp. DG1-102-2]